MIDRDEELRKVLREWKAPDPSTRLDARVWKSVEGARPPVRWAKRWLPIAAGIVVVTGLSMHLMSGPRAHEKPRVVSLKAITNAAGFEPLPEGEITVTRLGEKE